MSFVLQANSSNFGSMFIVLDPFDERQSPELRRHGHHGQAAQGMGAAQVKDAEVTVFGASPIPGLGVAGGFKLMVEDRGGLGLACLAAADRQPRSTSCRSRARPDRACPRSSAPTRRSSSWTSTATKVASLGVSLDDVNQTLAMYLGSLYVNSFNDFGRHWQVTIQADGEFRNRIEDINLFQVRNKQGQMVPLGTLVDVREIGGPISVTRYNLYTAAPITGNVQPGVSSGEAIAAIDELADETLPLSMKTEWTELMFMQIRAGNTAIVRLRAGRGLRLPGPGRAVRELVAAAGGDPGRAAVPALLGGRRAVSRIAT